MQCIGGRGPHHGIDLGDLPTQPPNPGVAPSPPPGANCLIVRAALRGGGGGGALLGELDPHADTMIGVTTKAPMQRVRRNPNLERTEVRSRFIQLSFSYQDGSAIRHSNRPLPQGSPKTAPTSGGQTGSRPSHGEHLKLHCYRVVRTSTTLSSPNGSLFELFCAFQSRKPARSDGFTEVYRPPGANPRPAGRNLQHRLVADRFIVLSRDPNPLDECRARRFRAVNADPFP